MKLIADKTVKCLDCGKRTLMKAVRASLMMLALFALPLRAQTNAQIAAKLDTLVMVIGDYNKAIPCSELDANRPALVLGDGGYPERFRLKQIGCAIDRAVALVDSFKTQQQGFQSQISGLAARLAAVETKQANGLPVGTAVFDKIRANQVCIGDYDCNSDWNAQLQIRGNYDAIVGLESNKLGTQSQSPRAHIGQVGLSSDGGVRIQQNMMGLFSRGFTAFVDPCRETLNLGPDSRANFSIDRGEVDARANPFTGEFCTPLPVPDSERTQSLVITTDQASKQITFLVWKPDWSIAFKTSTCKWCMDKVYLVPKQ